MNELKVCAKTMMKRNMEAKNFMNRVHPYFVQIYSVQTKGLL
jgi:hypothetical protein